jgi:hypothetical protein
MQQQCTHTQSAVCQEQRCGARTVMAVEVELRRRSAERCERGRRGVGVGREALLRREDGKMGEHGLVLHRAVRALQRGADVCPGGGARGGVRKRGQLSGGVLAAARHGGVAKGARLQRRASHQVVAARRGGGAGHAVAAREVGGVEHIPRRPPVRRRPPVGRGDARVQHRHDARAVHRRVPAGRVGREAAAGGAAEQVAIMQRRGVHLHDLHGHGAGRGGERLRIVMVRHHPTRVDGAVRDLRRRGVGREDAVVVVAQRAQKRRVAKQRLRVHVLERGLPLRVRRAVHQAQVVEVVAARGAEAGRRAGGREEMSKAAKD